MIRLKQDTAGLFLGITDPKAQDRLCIQIIAKDLTVRDVENALEYWKEHGSLPPEFSQKENDENKKGEKEEVQVCQKICRKLISNLKIFSIKKPLSKAQKTEEA